MTLPDAALDQLFRTARTYRAWRDQPVSDETLRAIYELMKWGPTSSNCSPARIVFVKSLAAKERLKLSKRRAVSSHALRPNCWVRLHGQASRTLGGNGREYSHPAGGQMGYTLVLRNDGDPL